MRWRAVVVVLLATALGAVCLGASAQSTASDLDPVLRIETGMHSAIVNRIALADDGRQLITVSDDKTTRLWSMANGAAMGIWRTPIGAGDAGALYAVAANGDTVAVGGLTADRSTEKNAVYIFDRRKGALRGTIRGFSNAVSALAFSPDGRFLAVGEQGPRGLTVIDFHAGKVIFHDRDYGDTIVWLAFGRDNRLAASSADGRLRLYGGSFGKPLVSEMPAVHGIRDQPWGLAFSPDGGKLAVGSRHEAAVQLFAMSTLTPIATLRGDAGNTGALAVVGWSADGTRIGAAGGYRDASGLHLVRLWRETGNRIVPGVDVGVARDLVTDLAFLPDGNLVFATAEPAFGVVNAISHGASVLQGPWKSDFRDAGNAFRVSTDGTVIDFPSRQRGNDVFRFNLIEGTLTRHPPQRGDLIPPSLVARHAKLSAGTDGVVKIDGRKIQMETDDVVRAAAVAPAGDAVLLGTEYYLQLEFAHGRSWRKVLPAPAWAVNVSGDGRYAVAALGDGTIRWFAMVDGGDVMALYVDPHDNRWVAWVPEGFFDHSPAINGPGGESLVGYHINNGPNKLAEFVDNGQLYSLFYRRDLVLDRIRGGMIGALKVNAQLVKIGNVRAVLQGGLPPRLELIGGCVLRESATACADTAIVKPKQKSDRTITVAGPGKALLVRYRIADRGGGFGRVIVRRGGAVIALPTAVEATGGRDRVEHVIVPLRPQQDEIRLASETANEAIQSGATDDLVIHVTAATKWVITSNAGESTKPQMYVVAVGISRYALPDFALRNAANDAEAVAQLFGSPSPPVYQVAHVSVLLDGDATAARITAALTDVAAKARPQDIVVLFFSGHGEAIDGKYYFAPVDFAAKDASELAEAKSAAYDRRAAIFNDLFRREGYGEGQLVPLLQKIEGNLLLVLDTCFSGSIATSDAIAQRARNETITNSVGREIGRFILAGARRLAADSAGTYNDETLGGHGLFTIFFLKGLMGEADFSHSGLIEVDELLKFTRTHVRDESRVYSFYQEPAYYFSGSNFFAVRADPAPPLGEKLK